MTYFNPHWLEGQRKRWMQPDAARDLKPDWRDRKYWTAPPPAEATHHCDLTVETTKSEFDQLYRECLEFKRIVTDVSLELSRRRMRFKGGYDPNQPRDDHGKWTDGGGSGPSSDGPSPDNEPKVPAKRPETGQERNAAIKTVARWIARNATPIGRIVQAGSWIQEEYASIEAYQDAPKSLAELQDAVSERKAGYDVHHIVERTPAAKDGYPRDMIDGRDNLVRIPRLKHWEINGWYGTKNRSFGDISPRDYLGDEEWAERTRVGHYALRKHGVLKP